MKKVTQYVCEKCGTQYKEEADAKRCEANHKCFKSFLSERFQPITVDASGYPQTINVIFEDGKVITYKR